MNTAVLVTVHGYIGVWLVGAGPAVWLTPELRDHYIQQGVPSVAVAPHDQFLDSIGLTRGEMIEAS
jgi:hypothetical protein